jgi:hypothetical protein
LGGQFALELGGQFDRFFQLRLSLISKLGVE